MILWYEDEVRALLAQIALCRPPPGLAVFYGSSSIRMWSTLHEDFPDLPVLNVGFGGSTLEACAHYFDRLVTPLQPGLIVLYAGDNDLGDGQHPEQVVRSFNTLLDKIDAAAERPPLVFISIKPSPARWSIDTEIRATNAAIAARLLDRPGDAYVDVYPLMLGHDGLPQPEFYAPDGLHLSQQGYSLWTNVLHTKIHQLYPEYVTASTRTKLQFPHS